MRLFPKKPSKSALLRRQKLQAAVARRGSKAPSIEEEEEPTTSFKTALVVVVLLHLVAAGGVYMFDSIKTHRAGAGEGDSAPAASQKTAAVTQAPAPVARPKPSAAPVAVESVKKSAPAPVVAEAKDSGNFYTVAKGDTLVSIAKKLRVGHDELLKLNQIDDPKKLRIGQKLRIPVKLRAAN